HKSSVSLSWNPAVRVRDPDPQSSVEPGLGPGCPGQRPGPIKQCEPVRGIRLSGSETRIHKAVWGRVLDPAVRVRDPDLQSSVGLVLNPAVRVRDPDPQCSVEPGLGPGCPGQKPGPTR